MIKRPKKTCIEVADGARARFFRPDAESARLVPTGLADLAAPQSRQRPRDLKSGRPGRRFSSSRSGARHSIEPPHDFQRLEKHRFMATLVATLEEACGRRESDDLILVAPRRSLGQLHSLLSKRVQDRVHEEVPKDLTNDPVSRLLHRLGPPLGEQVPRPLRSGRTS